MTYKIQGAKVVLSLSAEEIGEVIDALELTDLTANFWRHSNSIGKRSSRNMDNYFDGRHETVRLENGRSFGIPAHVYQCLAQAAISAQELGGIEPVLLDPLEDGKPGAVCCLYGKEFAFSILIECAELPPIVVLSMAGLDDNLGALPVVEGHADCFDVWRVIVSRMLQAEGLCQSRPG